MSGFDMQIRAFADKTNGKVDRAIREIALKSFRRVIMMSPVDTGRFRGNWQTAIGVQATGVIEAVDPTGQRVMAEVAGVTARIKQGDVIYMVNNLPYARRLEDGYSKQAPGGMVALTVQAYQPLADEVIRRIAAEG